MKKFLAVLSVLLLAFLVSFYLSLNNILSKKQYLKTHLRVYTGESLKSVIKKLEKEGFVENGNLLYYWARWKGIKLKEGCYSFNGNYSPVQVLRKLTTGSPCLVSFTIPEGSNIFDIDRILYSKGFCRKGEVISLSKNKSFLESLSLPCLEGFLYPDTYFVREKADCKEVIKVVVREFKSKVYPLLTTYTPPSLVKKALGDITLKKILIVASIVEKETNLKSEKPLIAGVIYNRLKKKMKLQCDPTVLYAYKIAGLEKRKLHKGDTSFPSPFNTYYVNGLPPTPICNPGLDSIKAAMYPKETDYLYFVSNGKKHLFSKSYNQHLKLIRKIYRNGKAVRN